MSKLLILLFFALIGLAANSKTYTYCVAVPKINFYPFRPITDGKDLAFLLFTRPYISTNENERGLLSAYEFSPDGLIFRGKVDREAKWADGTLLSPYDAALGIVKGFKFRTIGERVLTSEKDIKIIDERTFEIRFNSKIENLTGVIREALITSTRHNRVWPIRTGHSLEVIAIEPMVINANDHLISFLGLKDKVKIKASLNCNNSDMSLYMNFFKSNMKIYDFDKNRSATASLAVFNTKKLNIDERKNIALWIREKCKDLDPYFGMVLADGFFLKNEPGYSEKKNWSGKYSLNLLRRRLIKAHAEIPAYKDILERAAKADGLRIEFLTSHNKTEGKNIDFQIISTALINDRLIFLQDYLKWEFASPNFLEEAPMTVKALKTIAKQSAATIPPDNITLQGFEAAAREEWSIVPITRRYALAFSKLSSPFRIRWTSDGDLRIGPR